MYWVILEMKRSKGVLVTSEVSMQSALQWIEKLVGGCSEPVRIELLDAQQAGGVHIEMDERGIRAMTAHRTKNAHRTVASPAVVRLGGSGAPEWAGTET